MIPGTCTRLLEIGCGKGSYCRYLQKRRIEEVSGIDISREMISRARQFADKRNNVRFIRGDYLKTAFYNQFDCIICIAVAHHFNFNEFIDKIRTDLVKGGRLIVVDLYEPHPVRDFLFIPVSFMLSTGFNLIYNGFLKPPNRYNEIWKVHGKDEKYGTVKSIKINSGKLEGKSMVQKLFFYRYLWVWDL